MSSSVDDLCFVLTISRLVRLLDMVMGEGATKSGKNAIVRRPPNKHVLTK